ncbi:2-isopropylmalate synthase/methanogen homocitrate synthase [Haladaptatus litoreus]|uniref:2-isopropylmalate synthase n=2 Tax=Haladaptatus litoreus TaxID=553468 RepID=A0A1N7EKM9_9EURY|nr:2-isopropylmalate synthase/methanogen homocitrate synthase [Haladaptatus litoreus]
MFIGISVSRKVYTVSPTSYCMELLDLTLREGEQRSGYTYTTEQKIAVAENLSELGVEYIQLGFPVVDSQTKEVCTDLDITAKTTGIARAIQSDIDAAADAGVDVIDLFAPTSDLQRTHILGVGKEELLSRIEASLDYAHETGREVHFSAMDGFRTEIDFLNEIIERVNADYITIADTVGSQTPKMVEQTLTGLTTDLSEVGVHFHDDLGLATANALTASDCGVGKIDVSVAGVGERAGNTALEEYVIAQSRESDPTKLGVNKSQLISALESILDILDEDIAPQKPILGKGVFEHESGLHTAAMLDTPATFEPFDPADFGGQRHLLFGPSTGTGAAKKLLERANRDPTDNRIELLLTELDSQNEDLQLEEAVALAKDIR